MSSSNHSEEQHSAQLQLVLRTLSTSGAAWEQLYSAFLYNAFRHEFGFNLFTNIRPGPGYFIPPNIGLAPPLKPRLPAPSNRCILCFEDVALPPPPPTSTARPAQPVATLNSCFCHFTSLNPFKSGRTPTISSDTPAAAQASRRWISWHPSLKPTKTWPPCPRTSKSQTETLTAIFVPSASSALSPIRHVPI